MASIGEDSADRNPLKFSRRRQLNGDSRDAESRVRPRQTSAKQILYPDIVSRSNRNPRLSRAEHPPRIDSRRDCDAGYPRCILVGVDPREHFSTSTLRTPSPSSPWTNIGVVVAADSRNRLQLRRQFAERTELRLNTERVIRLQRARLRTLGRGFLGTRRRRGSA